MSKKKTKRALDCIYGMVGESSLIIITGRAEELTGPAYDDVLYEGIQALPWDHPVSANSLLFPPKVSTTSQTITLYPHV